MLVKMYKFSIQGLCITFFCLVNILVTPGWAKADTKAEVNKAIQTAYDSEDAAMARKDIEGYLAYHATDFIAIGKKGQTQGLEKERRSMLEFFTLPWKSGQFSSEIQDIKLNDKQGKQATVTVKRMGSIELVDPQTRRSGTLETEAVLRHFWVKEQKGWRLKREKAISLKAFMDGKPLGRSQ